MCKERICPQFIGIQYIAQGNLNFKASKLTLKETKIEDYDDFKMIYHGKPYTFIYDDMTLQEIYNKHLQDYKDYLAK